METDDSCGGWGEEREWERRPSWMEECGGEWPSRLEQQQQQRRMDRFDHPRMMEVAFYPCLPMCVCVHVRY